MAAWEFEVVPSDMPHRGPGMFPRDMRLVATSDDAAGSECSEPLTRSFCGPLVCCGPTRPATTVVRQPTLGRSELRAALGSWFARWSSGSRYPRRTLARAQGDGWQAQTDRLSWQACRLSFLLSGSAEPRRRSELTADSALTLPGRSSRSISLGGRKVFLLFASRQFFSQLPKQTLGKAEGWTQASIRCCRQEHI